MLKIFKNKNLSWRVLGAIPPHCYWCWWHIIKKHSWKLYHIPNSNHRGVQKCNSARPNSASQLIAKNGSWPMRFQYSLIVNMSLIDKYLTLIFGIDRHEWKKQSSLTGFLKKILIRGNGPFWTQKLWIIWICCWKNIFRILHNERG